jgi:hypothetical protein
VKDMEKNKMKSLTIKVLKEKMKEIPTILHDMIQ